MVEMSDLIIHKRSKRLRSLVWNDFKKIKKNGKDLAMCKNCCREFVGKASSGTTHLKKHLERCTKKPAVDAGHEVLAVSYKIKNEAPVEVPFEVPAETPEAPKFLSNVKFDQDQSQFDLTRMFILHGYPFSLVEHAGFKMFVNNLQPQFKMVSPSTVKADCISIFEQEKEKLFGVLDKHLGRISLTASIWKSYQNVSYLCLTAQYIDEAWALRKKILNFVMIESLHSGGLSEVIMTRLMDWNIYHKLFSMTMVSSFLNDNVVSGIRVILSQKQMLMGNGKLFHVQCASHILSLIAQDALELINEIIHKIRESVKYVKCSQAREEKFNDVANQVGDHSQRSLCLDVPAQWNTTYIMLDIALEYSQTFSCLHKHDPGYNMVPTDREWEMVSLISNHLKLLYGVVNDFLQTKDHTSNLYFPAICAMKLQLDEWSKGIDTFVSSMAMKVKANFDRYWKVCSMILAVAVILDPRFKMKLVEYYYHQIYGNDATDQVKEVYDVITGLYNEYAGHSTYLRYQEYSGRVESSHGTEFTGSLLHTGGPGDSLRGYDEFVSATSQNQKPKSDLELYLEECVSPRTHEFNILSWWRVSAPRYPVLSRLARDILGIPISTVSFEATFSSRGKVLDAYKSSLDPQTVQALVCAEDWLWDQFVARTFSSAQL
ncbi:unnamed protein product [Victoria cruziana]